MINSETHTIHGTGIFTYMNGSFICEMLVDIPYMDCMRNDSFTVQCSFFLPQGLDDFYDLSVGAGRKKMVKFEGEL